ncbi:MAG: Major Facilitator Superfamily [Rhodobacteraceae bacterium HLUCCA08]|nr:MAG: Major Facilitator Superfamily [Rhodobacteraceae bacterium HLUCCA08]
MTGPADTKGAAPAARPLFDAGFCEPGRRKLILVAAILASSMGFIDGTVTAIAMPDIRAALGASLADAQWIHNAYMVTISALILAGGALGDKFGLARTFSLGIGLFMAMSAICALAPTTQTLILARFAQGAGAALMVPGSLAIISRAYPRAKRGRAIALWASASAITTAMGPIVGGLALSFGGDEVWRWIFAINLPLGALALVLVRRGVARDNGKPDRPVDGAGAALATLALGLLAWAMISAEGGFDTRSLSYAGLGVLAFIAFLVQERRAPAPIMPLSLFSRSRVFTIANLVTFLLYFCLSAVLFYLPMLLIAGWGMTEIIAASAWAPMSLLIFLFAGRAGRLADRIGPGPLMTSGAALIGLAYGWLAVAIIGRDFLTDVLAPMTLMGLGMALVVAPLSAAVMKSVADDQTGIASGVNNAISRSAGLVAVAAIGPIAAGRYGLAGGPETYGAKSPAPDHVAAMTTAFSDLAWIFAGLALLAALASAIGLRPAMLQDR